MNKINACIVFISSRKKCIKHSLLSLWENYNNKYDYPVYVHYFDDIYDDKNFRDEINNSCEQRVIFKSVPYNTPDFIKEEELYYNRSELWYVRNSFSINRKGYLHMCHFTSNMYGYENTNLQEYDYVMTIDDESSFVQQMPYDPFERLKNRPELFGAMKVYDQNKKKPHQGTFDTRVNFWKFIKGYIKHYGIIPASKFFRDLLVDKNSDYNFNFYPIADSYIIKTEFFRTNEWKQWITAVNKYGGIYKYRWGDNDIYSLFYLIHLGSEIYDLKTVEDGHHSQNALRHIQDYAPSVKDIRK
mgnify:FL=1